MKELMPQKSTAACHDRDVDADDDAMVPQSALLRPVARLIVILCVVSAAQVNEGRFGHDEAPDAPENITNLRTKSRRSQLTGRSAECGWRGF